MSITAASASSGTQVLSSTLRLQVGDAVVQGTVEGAVEEVGEESGGVTPHTVRLTTAGSFTTGAATYHMGYTCTVRGMPHHGSAPALEKEYEACTLHFRRYGLTLAPTVTFVAEGDSAGPGQQVPRAPTLTTEEKSADWGDAVRPRNRRVLVPRQQSRATQLAVGLTVREARAHWALHGYSLHYEGGSGRNSR